jgi:hypothetical protein
VPKIWAPHFISWIEFSIENYSIDVCGRSGLGTLSPNFFFNFHILILIVEFRFLWLTTLILCHFGVILNHWLNDREGSAPFRPNMRHLKPAQRFRASFISLVTSRTLKTLSMPRAFEGLHSTWILSRIMIRLLLRTDQFLSMYTCTA